jgi:hypothetical protein
MSSQKIPVVSPCEAGEVEKWEREFTNYATSKDRDGFPLEGVFAMGFNCPLDLRTVDAENRKLRAFEAAREARREGGGQVKEGQISNQIPQLLAAFEAFKPGAIFAFKKGFVVEAFAEITAAYTYESDQAWGKHRWGYRVLRRATPEEAGPYGIPAKGVKAAHAPMVKTFYANYLALPADLPRLRSIAAAERFIAQKRAAEVDAEAEIARREAVVAEKQAIVDEKVRAFNAALRALEEAQAVRREARELVSEAKQAREEAAAATRIALTQRELADLF